MHTLYRAFPDKRGKHGRVIFRKRTKVRRGRNTSVLCRFGFRRLLYWYFLITQRHSSTVSRCSQPIKYSMTFTDTRVRSFSYFKAYPPPKLVKPALSFGDTRNENIYFNFVVTRNNVCLCYPRPSLWPSYENVQVHKCPELRMTGSPIVTLV